MLISNINPWAIIAPVLAAQYALALVALVFLSKRAPSVKSFILWNALILLVFFIGSIAFFIYNRVRPAVKEADGHTADGDTAPQEDETGAQDESTVDEIGAQDETAGGEEDLPK